MIPAFLRFPVCALNISNTSYKYLLLLPQHGAFVVSDFGEGGLPSGIVENGEIKQANELIAILRELFAKKGIQFVGVSLPEEKGFLKSVRVPATVPVDEIGSSLALQIEEYVPLPANDVIFDYILVDQDRDHFDVVLRAFPRLIVNSYLDAIAQAGALPVFVEPEINATVRATIPTSYTGTGMLIDCGRARTNFAIFHHGVVRFTATAPVGGNMITDAIAKQMNISVEEAERLKKTKGWLSVTQKDAEHNEVTQAVIPVLSAIREETERYMLYWQSRSELGSLPDRIYFVGGDANISGLPEYLSVALGISVSVANPWENVSFPPFYLPELSLRDSLRFASVIGLCLQAEEECGFYK